MSVFRRYCVIAAAFAVMTGLALPAPGRTGTERYARMAPVSWYLMHDRQAEIALAETAAPRAISQHATILVLGRHGYETAEKGSDGFTCLVERAWMSPFDSAEFWNWKNRSPICYNPAASRTVLHYTLQRTIRVLSGQNKATMLAGIRAAVVAGELPTPEPGSMSYMLSKRGYLNDEVGAWLPHLMFYLPQSNNADKGANWGANLPGSPVVYDSAHHILPEPEAILMIPVAHWSDGSRAPQE